MRSAFTSRSAAAAFLLALILAAAACRGNDRVDVAVEDQRLLRSASGAPELSGKLINRGSASLPSVQVQVVLYDADNVRVGQTYFVARSLEPGEPTPFREVIESEADVHRARVEGVFRL